MFTSEQVKKYILHPDPVVCNAALRYFSTSNIYEDDFTLMPLVLERFRQTENRRHVCWFYAEEFPQTEETLGELLDLTQLPELDINLKHQLIRIIIHSDVAVLRVFDEYFEQDKEMRRIVKEKRQTNEMADEELVHAFSEFIESCRGKYVNEINTFYGENLVRELSHRQCIPADDVISTLASYSPDFQDDGYESIYFAKLAGEMKLEAAIPILCEMMGIDDDISPSTAAAALIRIGTKAVITSSAKQYLLAEESYYRLFAVDIFGKIKLPESEEAILNLFAEEEDLTQATKLADALCELGSEKGYSLVKNMVEEGFESGYLNLKESLYAYCIISNIDHPSMQTWADEFEAERQRRDMLDKGVFNSKPSSASGKTSTTKSQKVGRNDPCPCGSGKKYKKCCGA